MYTREYYETENVSLPENYDGVAFRENNANTAVADSEKASVNPNDTEKPKAEDVKPTFFSSILQKLPFPNLICGLGDLFTDGRKEKNGTIEIEDILIAAVALYLFFSKEGDKECAIILALLLFI